MNAADIIKEIKHLPPGEKVRVVRFVRSMDKGRPWTAEELNEQAEKLVQEGNPSKALRLKDEIASGFYGKGRNA